MMASIPRMRLLELGMEPSKSRIPASIADPAAWMSYPAAREDRMRRDLSRMPARERWMGGRERRMSARERWMAIRIDSQAAGQER